MIDQLLYFIARALVGFLQALPLGLVARLGQAGGALAYWLDARHRRVALRNLAKCFDREKTPVEIRALARENFRRIGENYACAVKTASMSAGELAARMRVIGLEKLLREGQGGAPVSRVIAIGHFGNFELFARAVQLIPGHQGATTYRALRQPGLNRVLLSLRERSGCLFFERRLDGAALRAAIGGKNIILGLLSDQHAGDHGMRLPFFGHECSTTKAPAVFALRYELPLNTAFCFRERSGHWRIEVGDEIPTRENDQPRSVAAIMLDVNRAFEDAVRRDPANWFWVHNRWKPGRNKAPAPDPAPAAELELKETGDGG
jgi:KDO2-lipid IV(A) lauroyltransferase